MKMPLETAVNYLTNSSKKTTIVLQCTELYGAIYMNQLNL